MGGHSQAGALCRRLRKRGKKLFIAGRTFEALPMAELRCGAGPKPQHAEATKAPAITPPEAAQGTWYEGMPYHVTLGSFLPGPSVREGRSQALTQSRTWLHRQERQQP